jgi:hypothetical protein
VIGYLTIIAGGAGSTTSTNINVLLNNVPKNAGQRSFYVLSVAPVASALAAPVVSASVFFPDAFGAAVGGATDDDALACGVVQAQVYDDDTWNDYQSLLALTTGSTLTRNGAALTYSPSPCALQDSRVVQVPLPGSYNSSLWTHFVFTNVINPPAYDETDHFQIALQSADGATKWLFRQHLVYFLS